MIFDYLSLRYMFNYIAIYEVGKGLDVNYTAPWGTSYFDRGAKYEIDDGLYVESIYQSADQNADGISFYDMGGVILADGSGGIDASNLAAVMITYKCDTDLRFQLRECYMKTYHNDYEYILKATPTFQTLTVTAPSLLNAGYWFAQFIGNDRKQHIVIKSIKITLKNA